MKNKIMLFLLSAIWSTVAFSQDTLRVTVEGPYSDWVVKKILEEVIFKDSTVFAWDVEITLPGHREVWVDKVTYPKYGYITLRHYKASDSTDIYSYFKVFSYGEGNLMSVISEHMSRVAVKMGLNRDDVCSTRTGNGGLSWRVCDRKRGLFFLVPTDSSKN